MSNDREFSDSTISKSSAGVITRRMRDSMRQVLEESAVSIGAAAAHCGTGAAYSVAPVLTIEDDSPPDGNESRSLGE